MRSRSRRGLRTTEARDADASQASGLFVFSDILLFAIYRSTSMNMPILPPNKHDGGKSRQ